MYDTLVLSGGGLNGFVMLGALQYCKDNSLIEKIQTYVGTSVGSVISYLLIIGYTPIEIVVNLCVNTSLFEKLATLDIYSSIQGDGAISFSHIAQHIEKMTLEKIGRTLVMREILDLYGKNLICVTYNMTKGMPELISPSTHPDIPCINALRMSCNIPLIFEHYNYCDNYYIDGGVHNSFPLDIGQTYGTRVLGICLCADFMKDQNDQFVPHKSLTEYILRVLRICLNSNAIYNIYKKAENTDLILLKKYENQSIATFSVNSKIKLELFSSGYEEAKTITNKNNL